MDNKTNQKVEEAMTTPKSIFDLNQHIFRLLLSEPFFAGMSRRINKVSTTNIPTAGVWVNPATANFELLYNPAFFEGITDKQKLGVIKHELYHLIFEHVTTRKPENKSDHQTWNIAADLAINSYLVDELPDFCCFPEKGKFAKYIAKQSTEAYFGQLKNDPEMQQKDQSGEGQSGKGQSGKGQSGKGQSDEGQFDSHEKWDESGEANSSDAETIREMAKERLKDVMRKAAHEVGQKNGGNWGSISAEMRQEILERIAIKIDWKKVLRYFIKTSRRSHKTSTPRRVNKRYAYIHPGKRINRTANIAISIDQSGSVSDEMLVKFFSALNELAKLATFTVIPFDSKVIEDKIFVWKKGQQVKVERVSCGGTDFNPPTNYVNNCNEFDGHIVLTDLCAPKPIGSKVQRLWVATKEYASNPYFSTCEKIISVD